MIRKKLRLIITIGLFTLAMAIAGKSIFLPTPSSPSKSLPLPSNLSLENWRLIGKFRLNPQQNGQKRGIVYRHQLLTNPQQKLRLEIRAEPNIEGNVSRLVSLYQKIQPAFLEWKLTTIPQEGTVALYRYQDQLHLTACLNDQGHSTVTEQEFMQKDHKFSQLFSRLLPWLIGQNSIYTSDCWWILLSLPLKNETDSSQVKESAILLIDTWKSLKNNNFPREFIAD
jgi:cyanosortase A-associated protein